MFIELFLQIVASDTDMLYSIRDKSVDIVVDDALVPLPEEAVLESSLSKDEDAHLFHLPSGPHQEGG